MRTKFIGKAILCAGLGLAGCSSPPTQEQTGMVVGGALGGILGSQVGSGTGSTVAAVAGTLLGAAIGGSVGRSMDQNDRIQVSQALETGQTGTPTHWRNPDTGNQYRVVPTRTYEKSGTPCREYIVNGVVGGKPEEITGTACRQADGSWRATQ
ncbi:MAG: RT0821/Lpp0805 family surface protein [Pseudomonadota bacterium]